MESRITVYVVYTESRFLVFQFTVLFQYCELKGYCVDISVDGTDRREGLPFLYKILDDSKTPEVSLHVPFSPTRIPKCSNLVVEITVTIPMPETSVSWTYTYDRDDVWSTTEPNRKDT